MQTPLWCGPSGHLAHPIPNTGCDPKFCINVSCEHTPINLPTSHHECPESSTSRRSPIVRTLTYFDSPELQAVSSIRLASRVHTSLKHGSTGTSLTNVSADYDSVESRTSITDTCADMDREPVGFKSFRVCVTGERRSRPKRCAHIKRQDTSPQYP